MEGESYRKKDKGYQTSTLLGQITVFIVLWLEYDIEVSRTSVATRCDDFKKKHETSAFDYLLTTVQRATIVTLKSNDYKIGHGLVGGSIY